MKKGPFLSLDNVAFPSRLPALQSRRVISGSKLNLTTNKRANQTGTKTGQMKTFSAKAEEIDRKWHVIDAEGKVLGDVAVAAARLLRGKHKAIFTPHCDTGDHVVVINAEKVVLTGKKEDQKIYTSYSGYVGGQKRESVRDLRERRPELIVERAITGMIPHNRLGRQIVKKLRVYVGPEHQQEAQNPQPYEL